MGSNKQPPAANPPKKDEEDRTKFLGYILPIFTDYAENNRIDPIVCYEVCHELELSVIENCRAKGIDGTEIEMHRQIAEMKWKASKEAMMRDEVLEDDDIK
jgi:hypothetical protein